MKRTYVYTCKATGTKLWAQPFDNLDTQCSVCKKDGVATVRCQQCHVELCDECDTVEHWSVVKSAHRRDPIENIEKEWRKQKIEFDERLQKNRRSVLMLDLKP